MHISRAQCGTYTGTGAAQTITLGFRPVALFIYNQTDGDSLAVKLDSQAAAVHCAIGAAVANVASGGVTLSARGFSTGTDASSSENLKVFHYLAIG
jgi:hypothetical protein